MHRNMLQIFLCLCKLLIVGLIFLGFPTCNIWENISKRQGQKQTVKPAWTVSDGQKVDMLLRISECDRFQGEVFRGRVTDICL
jgi:hypothetical protein